MSELLILPGPEASASDTNLSSHSSAAPDESLVFCSEQTKLQLPGVIGLTAVVGIVGLNVYLVIKYLV